MVNNLRSTCIFLVVLVLNNFDAYSNDKYTLNSVFYNIGIQKSSYFSTLSNNVIIKTPLVILTPHTFGLEISNKANKFQITYTIQNFRQGSPKWENLAPFTYSIKGPYFEHAIGGMYLREIYFKGRYSLSIGAGITFKYIPQNKFDEDVLPVDSLFSGYNIKSDQSGNKIYELRYHDRFVSSFYCTFNTKVQSGFELNKRFDLVASVVYNQGTRIIFKSDYWFVDYTNGHSGKGQIANRGSALGIEIGLRIKLHN